MIKMKQIPFDENTAREITAKVRPGQIKTRDGFPVRILDWGVKNVYRIAGVVMLGSDEYVKQWTADGKSDRRPNVTTNYDLVLEVEEGGD